MALPSTAKQSGHSERLNSSKRQTENGWCVLPLILLAIYLSTSNPSYAEPARLFRIGVLTASWGKPIHVQGLLDGLGELGYREDHDFVLGIRYTRGNTQDLEKAALDLVEGESELIVTTSIVTTQAVKQATTQIPIVFTGVAEPIGSGLINSYAQPGGNITGVSTLDIELAQKRLQVFQELIPTLKRVLYVYDPTDIYPTQAVGLLKQAAHRLGIELVIHTVETEDEVHTLFSQIDQLKLDGVLSATCCVLNIAGSILKLHQKIPTMFHTAGFWIEHGALASYGPNTYVSGHQSAHIVEKIMKGMKPAKIPVEVNSNIKFTINLKTAKTLGIVIPPEVLIRANDVVR